MRIFLFLRVKILVHLFSHATIYSEKFVGGNWVSGNFYDNIRMRCVESI